MSQPRGVVPITNFAPHLPSPLTSTSCVTVSKQLQAVSWRKSADGLSGGRQKQDQAIVATVQVQTGKASSKLLEFFQEGTEGPGRARLPLHHMAGGGLEQKITLKNACKLCFTHYSRPPALKDKFSEFEKFGKHGTLEDIPLICWWCTNIRGISVSPRPCISTLAPQTSSLSVIYYLE